MTHSQNSEPVLEADRLARFPALANLGLTEGDLGVLARQGCLAPERRQERTYYKLRFRRGGRQIVRYVGGTEKAARVAEDLKTLQTAYRCQRELDRIARAARQLQRDARAKLEPQLLERGFKFHGLVIRRSRRPGHQINTISSTQSRHGDQT